MIATAALEERSEILTRFSLGRQPRQIVVVDSDGATAQAIVSTLRVDCALRMGVVMLARLLAPSCDRCHIYSDR